jgi:hypothetical protein
VNIWTLEYDAIRHVKILQKTNDGNDLTPKDLKIVEMAVNGHLNDEGWKYFDDLYKKYMD